MKYENWKNYLWLLWRRNPKSKKDVFGIEREYYRMGKLNYGYPFTDINCRNLGIDLCERCAGNISLEMYKRRMELINNRWNSHFLWEYK